MRDTFITYRSFNDKAFALELFNILTGKGLPVKWEDSERYFDVTFAYNQFLHTYYIKLRKQDFSKADIILDGLISESKSEPGPGYYLYSFTDAELIEILKKPDEWNEFDRYWAKKILQQKGIEITNEEIEKGINTHFEELRKPWYINKIWIPGALLLILIAFRYLHIFSAVFGIFLGMYIAFAKKTIPGGDRMPAFTSGNRVFGKIILIVSIILSLFIFLYFFRVFQFDWNF